MCWCLYLTMLTREHPSQRRHATTRWTEWLILWTLARLLPWRPQGWHGGALRRVTVMARVNVRQTRLKNRGPILLKQIYLLTLWNGQPASCRDWHRALKIVPFLEEAAQPLDGELISSDPSWAILPYQDRYLSGYEFAFPDQVPLPAPSFSE